MDAYQRGIEIGRAGAKMHLVTSGQDLESLGLDNPRPSPKLRSSPLDTRPRHPDELAPTTIRGMHLIEVRLVCSGGILVDLDPLERLHPLLVGPYRRRAVLHLVHDDVRGGFLARLRFPPHRSSIQCSRLAW
jgi:hypothetical protein